MTEKNTPQVESLGNGYNFNFGDKHTIVKLTRLHGDNQHTLTGELEVRVFDNTILSGIRFNLQSQQARKSMVKDLGDFDPSGDWKRIVGEVCSQALIRFREGEPPLEIWPDDEPFETPYLIEPILYLNHPTVIFGDYGSAKSTLALSLAYVAQLPFYNNSLGLITGKDSTTCLYLDYEDDNANFKGRWSALERGFGQGAMPIIYRRMSSPISDDIEQIVEICTEKKVDFLIIDSLGLAAGGNLNDAEPAIKYHSALRRLNRTSLTLAHTSKDPLLKRRTIFGSIFFTNLARSVWECKMEQEVEEEEAIISLKQTKANLSKIHPTMGFKFLFVDNAIKLVRQDLADTTLAGELPLRLRIKHELRTGKFSVPELAERLEKSQDTIRKTLSRGQDTLFIKLPDGLWGLKILSGTDVTGQQRQV